MEKEIVQVAKAAIVKAIETELVGYNKPLSKFVDHVLEQHRADFIRVIDEEVSGVLDAESFRIELRSALNEKLARVLVSRLGGELEKQVNELKANPETRAKITIALSQVLSELQRPKS